MTIDEQNIRRKVREINDHIDAGKPVYWGRTPEKRFRVFRARFSKGRFQILSVAGLMWLEANLGDDFELSR